MPKYRRGILLVDIISFNKHRLTYVPTVHGGQNKISFLTVCSRTMKKDSRRVPSQQSIILTRLSFVKHSTVQAYLRLGGIQDGQGELLLHQDLAGALVCLLKSRRLHTGSHASHIGLKPVGSNNLSAQNLSATRSTTFETFCQ
jgi:hypothetical protein